MPVVFKEETKKPFIVIKDGTEFVFNITSSVIREANLMSFKGKKFSSAAYIENLFRLSLCDWKGDGVVDEKGNKIPFSEELRDELVLSGKNDDGLVLFSLEDIAAVHNYFFPESKKK